AVTGAQDEIVAGRELGLALRRSDGAGVVDLGAHQQHEAAARRHRGRRIGGDQRAALDHDLAARAGEVRHIDVAALARIDAITELAVGDVGAGGDQRADIDLARAAEDDAVLIDHQHLAGSGDAAEDLARPGVADDAVQRGPVAGLLVEVERGLAADVEALPVEDCLRRGLVDGHRGLAAARGLARQRGALPEGRAGHGARCNLKPAHGKTVRHRHLRQRGGSLRGGSRAAGRRLRGLQRLDGLGRPGQRALALPCDFGCLLGRGGGAVAGDRRRRIDRSEIAERTRGRILEPGQQQRQRAGSGQQHRAG
ncbi:hypothetical protein chiPu_0029071, partial [Chiloscyllium punctatum]|nr:hypothetical protein [Chiloscyllium punctatum]